MNRQELRAALENKNVLAFLSVVRTGEGTLAEDGYQILYGGQRFTGFGDHPRRKITAGSITSSAAGAYQFLSKTWDGLVSQYGFPDFSPACQDEAAVALIAGRHALGDVISGRFDIAVDKCNREWASLPGSPYGQPTLTLARARKAYAQAGGRFDPQPAASIPTQSPAPVEERSATSLQEPPMIPAMIPIVLDVITSLVPAMAGVLTDKSKSVAERNTAAAVKVVEAAKQAIDAKNEQELVERIQSDPAAAVAVKQAVQSLYFDLVEAGGGGIEGARKADAAFIASGSRPWQSPAFVVSLLLMAIPFMLLSDVFFIHPAAYDGTLRTQVVTACLAVIMVVSGYWLGTSSSSQRKTEIMGGGR